MNCLVWSLWKDKCLDDNLKLLDGVVEGEKNGYLLFEYGVLINLKIREK